MIHVLDESSKILYNAPTIQIKTFSSDVNARFINSALATHNDMHCMRSTDHLTHRITIMNLTQRLYHSGNTHLLIYSHFINNGGHLTKLHIVTVINQNQTDNLKKSDKNSK